MKKCQKMIEKYNILVRDLYELHSSQIRFPDGLDKEVEEKVKNTCLSNKLLLTIM